MLNFKSMLLVGMLCIAGSMAFGQMPPSDSGKHQLIVVGLPDAIPAKWFSSNAELAKVKQAVQFTVLAPTSKLYRERYQESLGIEFPIVAYLRPDGGAIYVTDRNSMPSTGNDLFQEMKSAVLLAKNAQPSPRLPADFEIPYELMQSTEDCPDGNCPLPNNDSDWNPRRPFRTPQVNRNPLDQAVGGFLSNSISGGIWFVFTIIALGCVMVFCVLLLGAMYIVGRILK